MAVNQGSPGVRVLVTGAAGSRGPHLTRAPPALGYSVNGLDLDAPNHAAALWSGMDHPNSGMCGVASRTSSPRTSPVTGWWAWEDLEESSDTFGMGGVEFPKTSSALPVGRRVG